jgi:hypothetical protein
MATANTTMPTASTISPRGEPRTAAAREHPHADRDDQQSGQNADDKYRDADRRHADHLTAPLLTEYRGGASDGLERAGVLERYRRDRE